MYDDYWIALVCFIKIETFKIVIQFAFPDSRYNDKIALSISYTYSW